MKYLSVVLALVMCLYGCSSETTTEPENTPPEISITFGRKALPRALAHIIEATIVDEDGDNLSVSWTVSRGSIDLEKIENGTASMRWTPPLAVGVDTVTAVASDGTVAVSDICIIEIGTLREVDIATALVQWKVQDSPVILRPATGWLGVRSQGTLEIQAGVTVYIDIEEAAKGILVVDGTLRINGTAGSPVTIRPNQRVMEVGSWDRIHADPTGKIVANYADVSHAKINFRADTQAELSLKQCALKFSEDAAVLYRSNGVLKIDECSITDNEGDGIRVELISGIPDTIQIKNSTIRFNQKSGVVIDLPDTSGETEIVIEGNIIQANSFHGVQLKNAVYPKINHNAIFNNDIFKLNGGYNLRLEPPFGGMFPSGMNIDGRENFWGGAFELKDSLQVAELMIYDGRDDATVNSRVLFIPWLNEHP